MDNVMISNYKLSNNLDIERIIKEYSNYIYKIIVNSSVKVLTDEDIEEIVSDVFFALWKNSDKLDLTKPIQPYLAGITKNMIKNKYRKVNYDLDINDYEEVINLDETIEILAENNEKNKIIENTLKTLRSESREIFYLFYYYSKKVKEISKELNISEWKVKTDLHRTRKKIQQELIKEGYSNE